jgi:hypothetical protein
MTDQSSAGATPELSTRRRWAMVIFTTLIVAVSYLSLLLGLGGIGSGDGQATGAALATGLTLMPLCFGTAAFMSDHSRPALAIVRAIGAWFLVGVLVLLDAMVGLVAAYAAGCAVSLARPPDVDWTWRVGAVATLVLVATIARMLVPGAVVLTAPVAIVLTIMFADDLALAQRGGDAAP